MKSTKNKAGSVRTESGVEKIPIFMKAKLPGLRFFG
jgi:hypothetical protein